MKWNEMKVLDSFSFATCAKKSVTKKEKSTIKTPEQCRDSIIFLVMLRAYVFDFTLNRDVFRTLF